MGRIIAFVGADSQVGCTMLAQSCAEELGKKENVLLVLASGKYGDDYIANRTGASIDDLKANLISGHLEAAELRQTLIKGNGIRVLPGVRDPLAARYYPENALASLIEAAEDFDRIILDCGDRIELGLVLSGIRCAQERILVLTQQEKTLRRARFLREAVLEPLALTGRIVINKYQHALPLPSGGMIGEELESAVIAKVPYTEYGWQAESEGRPLAWHRRALREIRKICAVIGEEEERKRTWKDVLTFKSI